MQKVIRDSSESLHLFKDAIGLYTKPTSMDPVIDAIDALSSLVGPNDPETLSVDFVVLPASLHDLIPLIKRWAVTDNGEREALLEEASESELADLVASVEPHLSEIDHYLDSEAASPPAIYIGALAECAVEARLYLKRLREEKR